MDNLLAAFPIFQCDQRPSHTASGDGAFIIVCLRAA